MFHQITHNGITYLQSDVFPAGIRHGFSTRLGGISAPPWDTLNLGVGRGDSIENVRENYRRFCAELGTNAAHCVLSRQTHGDTVRLVHAQDRGKGLWAERDYTGVDGFVCAEADTPLVVFSADCNVILLYDPVRRVIGAVHAGWRGTALGIAGKAVRTMTAAFGSDPQDICAAIGPAIGPCCFETDGDVPAALHAALGHAADAYIESRGEKYHVDLKRINALWLQRAGVERTDICALCSKCRTDLFWSHRAHGNARGSQIAMIALEAMP